MGENLGLDAVPERLRHWRIVRWASRPDSIDERDRGLAALAPAGLDPKAGIAVGRLQHPARYTASCTLRPLLTFNDRVRGAAAGVLQRVRVERIARAGTVSLKGTALPPASIRLGGHNFESDQDFLDAAVRDAARLEETVNITVSSRILDIGCGVGRLPIGLRAHFGKMPRYVGVDVNAGVIRWCKRHINDPEATFIHLDLANDRYNPRGDAISSSLRLPLPDGSFDAIYLYSVFSHMTMPDVAAYLHEFRRLLAAGGTVFLTAFVENDVENETINPPGYGTFPGKWEGALHCVRFAEAFFANHVHEAGLQISRLDHASDTDGQSAIYLKSKPVE